MDRYLSDAEIMKLRGWISRTWRKPTPPFVESLAVSEAERYVRDSLAKMMIAPPRDLSEKVAAFLEQLTYADAIPPAADDIAAEFTQEGIRRRGKIASTQPVSDDVAAAPQPLVAKKEPEAASQVTPPAAEQPRARSGSSNRRTRRQMGRPLTYHERFMLRLDLWKALGGPDYAKLPPDDPQMTDGSVDLYIDKLVSRLHRSIDRAAVQMPSPSQDGSAAATRKYGLHRFRSRAELAEERRRKREQQRQKVEEERTRRTDAIYRMEPVLQEYQLHLQVLVRDMIKTMLSGRAKSAELEFDALRRQLTAKRDARLAELGIEPEAFELHWNCPACQDTGWLAPKPARTVDPNDPSAYPPEYYPPEKCDCLRREEIEDLFRAAGLQGPQRGQTFESFRTDIYPEKTRSHIEEIVDRCMDFADALTAGEQPTSLVIEGTAGGGKTHLACAVANECILAKRTVVYATMTDFIEIARLRTLELNDENRDFLSQVLNADLLIIDDLGAEKITEYTAVELTNALNHRLNNCLPLFITTNLAPKDIKEHYGERIYSRLVNGCEVLNLEPGVDVREALRNKP